jgi:hypothetical protein
MALTRPLGLVAEGRAKYMLRSYRKLVREAEQATMDLIRDAWDTVGKKGNADLGDVHPQNSADIQDSFLRDVLNHLS